MNQANDRRTATPALAAGIIAIALLSGCVRFEAREVMATVLFARGNAVARSGPQIGKQSHPIAVGSLIPSGNQIQTSRDAVVALSLIPGVSIEVEGETDLAVERLRVAKDGDAMVDAMRARVAIIRLKNGVIRASLRQMESSRSDFEVQTKQGTIVARPGAIFSVRADAEILRVICLRGETGLRDSHDNSFHQIPAGYYRDYTSDRNGNLLAALEDPQVEEEAAAGLATASFLERLELLARNAPAPWRRR
jgi:hypothetical protein